MNTAKIIAITQPLLAADNNQTDQQKLMGIDEFVAYVARVSNPSNQYNSESSSKLLKYLVKHSHWSPFEMVNVVMQIDTTRDIARQILRHRSFSFQEFSQRYADPTADLGFSKRDARLQDLKNRQNSVDTDDKTIKSIWNTIQEEMIDNAARAYSLAISMGVAKEQARAVLPEGLTNSRLYMNGTLRSFIHWVGVRSKKAGAQAEHTEITISAKKELLQYFPSLDMIFAEE
jgi:thymidylate synthase (FAD)